MTVTVADPDFTFLNWIGNHFVTNANSVIVSARMVHGCFHAIASQVILGSACARAVVAIRICRDKKQRAPTCSPAELALLQTHRTNNQSQILAVWILAVKLPNSDLNFAVDVCVVLFLLFFQEGPKN